MAMPLTTLDHIKGDDDTCAICRKDYEIDDEVATTRVCHHMFHHKCLKQMRNKKCPSCRTEIRYIDVCILKGRCGNMLKILFEEYMSGKMTR